MRVRVAAFFAAFFAVSNFAPLTALSAPAAIPSAASSGSKVRALFTSTFGQFIALSPEFATELGDYSHDASWSDPTEAGIAKQQALADKAQASLDAIDMKGASLRDLNDAKLFRAQLVGIRRGIADARTGKDPGGPAGAIVGTIFTMVLRKPGQDNAVWWDHVISRLEKAPGFLAASRPMITHPGRLQGVVASEELAQAPGLFTGLLTSMATSLPADKRARFEKARDATVKAITDWKTWIDANDASWPQNFSMGRSAYAKMLRDEQLLPYSADEIIKIGQRTLDQAIAEEAWVKQVAAARGLKLDASTGGGPTPLGSQAQFAFAQRQLDYLRSFVQRNGIVTVPSYIGKMKIVPTPAFLLPILPGAFMNPPPLLSNNPNGVYFIPPPNPQMAAMAAKGAIFEDYDRDRLLGTSGHEGIPGHFLQLSIAKHNADPVRRYSFDGVFSEGWAFYEEEMLLRMGLYGNDLDARYAIAQFERLRGARAVVDAKMATGAWTFDQALAWFERNAGVDAKTAQGEVRRHALGPGQAYDYAVGKTQIEELLTK